MIADNGRHYLYRHISLYGKVFYIGIGTKLKNQNKKNKYIPINKFDGCQECFLKIEDYEN